MRIPRALARRPVYSACTTLVIALSVGALLVVFSYVNALWLRPRPGANPERVVVIGSDFDIPDGSRYSEAALTRFQAASVFEAVAGQVVTTDMFTGLRPRVRFAGVERPLETVGVTPDYFAVLGIPVTGRSFQRSDALTSNPAPAIISDRLWRTAFGARGDALGSIARASPVDLQIVGIAARDFHGARLGEDIDVWLPHRALLVLAGGDAADVQFATLPMVAFARLRDGMSIAEARARLSEAGRQAPEMVPLADVFGAADRPMVRAGGVDALTIAGAAAGLVLLGTCFTLLTIVLLHLEQRRGELAVRTALGATRRRLAAGLAVELLALSAFGTAGALAVSSWALRLLPTVRLPGGLDFSRVDLTSDWRVLAAGAAGCTFAMIAGGIVPLLRATRIDLGACGLGDTGTSPRSSLLLRTRLLAAHAAVTVTILCAAAVVVRSAAHTAAEGPGFDADETIFATVTTRDRFQSANRPEIQTRVARDISAADDVLEQIRALPGVDMVAIGPAPLGLERETRLVSRPRAGPPQPTMGWLAVGAGYVRAIGAPLLAGREGLNGEVVIGHTLARERWGDESPIGQLLPFGSASYPVVGVTDIAFGSIRRGRAPFALYFGDMTIAGTIGRTGNLPFAIRSAHPDLLRSSIEGLLARAFPDAPAIEIATGRDLVQADLGNELLGAWLLSSFGGVTTVSAVVSIVGLVVHLMATRRREFAVRLALGASHADLAGRALRACLAPVAAGAALGVIPTAVLARSIAVHLPTVDPVAPLTYAVSVAAVLAAAALAGAAAAFRIGGVSPAAALRSD
jgi:predicted permease